MAGVRRPDVGAAAEQLDIDGTLLRAALLAGYGREARPLARRLSAATESGRGRSCLEAGAPILLTVDAPGPPGLRVGLRIGDRFSEQAVEDLVPPETRRHLAEILLPLPAADYSSLGTWLFWTEKRQSIFVDLRDPSPVTALVRLRRILSRERWDRLERLRPAAIDARPWAFRVEADEKGVCRLHVHWLIGRHTAPESLAEAIAPGCWSRAIEVLACLLRWPGRSGRWVIVTPLDDDSEPALRISNSAWALAPEGEAKHQVIGTLMSALGGPRDHAQALWSLCRGSATPEWRVGRACELKVGISGDGIRARLFFSPQLQGLGTAGISNSAVVAGTSSTAPSDAAPSSA